MTYFTRACTFIGMLLVDFKGTVINEVSEVAGAIQMVIEQLSMVKMIWFWYKLKSCHRGWHCGIAS